MIQLRQLSSQLSRMRRLNASLCSFSKKGFYAFVREGLDHLCSV